MSYLLDVIFNIMHLLVFSNGIRKEKRVSEGIFFFFFKGDKAETCIRVNVLNIHGHVMDGEKHNGFIHRVPCT